MANAPSRLQPRGVEEPGSEASELKMDRWSPNIASQAVDLGNSDAACLLSKLAHDTPDVSGAGLGPISSLEDFVESSMIYKGRETRVVGCLTKSTRVPVVVKLSVKASMSARQKALVENEIRLSRSLSQHRHSNIAALLNAFEEENHYCQVLESCGQGDLYLALHRHGKPFSESVVVKQVMLPLLETLDFIHRQGVIHRDVKLENLLMSNGRLKLADFGLAVQVAEGKPRIKVGTLDYNAPEVTRQPNVSELEAQGANATPTYDEKVDVWAAGVVAYELLMGHPPFHMPDTADTTALIRDGNLPGFLGFLSDECVDFLRTALRKTPEDRPSAAELLQHPWLALEEGTPSSVAESLFDSDEPSPAAPPTTFDSPNPSLSPRLGSWKIGAIPECSEGSGVTSLAEPLSPEAACRRTRRILFEPQPDLQDMAEDVQPKLPGPFTGSSLGEKPRTLRYVEVAPDLDMLREEVESAFGAPKEPDTGSEATADPVYLVPTQLRRHLSAGKSRFA